MNDSAMHLYNISNCNYSITIPVSNGTGLRKVYKIHKQQNLELELLKHEVQMLTNQLWHVIHKTSK